jgi:hypothetical protein
MRRVMLLAFAVGAVSVLGACSETVDPTGLPSIDGYQDWTELDYPPGPVPGHGDSYRKVFINPVARLYPHGGRYPIGSVLVKEIYDNDNGTPGDLRYIAVMRKVEDDQAYVEEGPEVDAPVDGGWVFTTLSEVGGSESHGSTCWGQCHKQAPYDGAWLDYGF